MEKFCVSCGMPMKNEKDFALHDTTKEYCIHCSDENGNLRSYDEVLENWANFLVELKELDKEIAINQVKKEMEKLPAWKDKK